MTERKAKITLAVLFVLSLIMLFFATKASVSYEFEKFFPAHSEEVTFYESFRSRFETDNDFLMIGIESDSGVFNVDFFERIKLLSDSLAELNYVESVQSPHSLKRIQKEPLSGRLLAKRLFRYNDQSSIDKAKEKVLEDPMLTPVLFSKDGMHCNLILKHKQKLSKKGCDELRTSVTAILESAEFKGFHLSGRAVAQSFYVRLMNKELIKFSSISVIIVIFFLYFTYRNLWSVIVPLFLVALSALWTIGLMTVFGKALDILLIVLPTLIFIVGISDVVHLYTKYLFLKREGMEKYKAINKTMNDVGIATLLTSVTTAIGFASLYFVNVPIIQEFGLVSALGVIVTFIVTFLAFMSFLAITNEKYISNVVQSDFWRQKLGRSFVYILRNGKMITLIFGVFITLSLWAGTKLEQKNKLLEELPLDSFLLSEIDYFNSNFVATRPFELALMSKDDESVFSYERIKAIDQLDSFLVNDYGVEFLLSPASFVKKVNLDLHKGDPEYYSIPNEDEYEFIKKNVTSKRFQREMKRFIDFEKGVSRVSARVHDLGSVVFIEKNKELEDFYETSLLKEHFDIRVTGTAHLIDKSNEVLTENLIKGLLAAFTLIAILVGIIFRSAKMVLIILLVNLIPLIGIAGIMGILGIHLKISTAVIFSIAFGIAVDDTIHFMSKYRLAMNGHSSQLFALKNTFQSTGRAIILTTIILIGGFFALLFSSFLGTYYIGLLVSGTLVLALITDLLLLPYLLRIIQKH